jgi:hypothetical protein
MSLKLELLAALCLLSLEPPAEAHDIYSPLRDSFGNSCCDEKDCRPALYRVTPTGVQMFVYGEWIAVPDYTIRYQSLLGDTGETGGGHWCGRIRRHDDGVDYTTHCAVLPPNPTAIFGPAFALREGRIRPIP